jgi:hypothetical protein
MDAALLTKVLEGGRRVKQKRGGQATASPVKEALYRRFFLRNAVGLLQTDKAWRLNSHPMQTGSRPSVGVDLASSLRGVSPSEGWGVEAGTVQPCFLVPL